MEKEKKEVAPVEAEDATLKESNSTAIQNGLNDLSEKANGVLNKKVGGISVKTVVCGVVALLVVIVLFSALFGGKDEVPDYPLLFENEDGDLMIVGKKGEAKKLASIDDDSVDVAYSNTSEKYVLYTKSGSLYIYNASKKNADPEKIDSDVEDFGFSKDDKYVYYLDEEGDLYSYNMKESSKLDSDVSRIVRVLEDKIIYTKSLDDGDSEYFIRSYKEKKDDRQKIGEGVSSLIVSENEKELLYKQTEDDSKDLYLYKISKGEPEKIASDVKDVVGYTENFSKIYYTVEGDFATGDLINDKMAKSDSSYEHKELDRDDFDSLSDYWDAQDEQDDIERAIEVRNDIRDYINEMGIASSKVMLYDGGKESEEVASGVGSIIYIDAEEGIIAYTKKEASGSVVLDDKYNGSDKTLSDFRNEVEKKIETKSYVLNGKKEIEITDEAVDGVAVDGGDIYYWIEDSESGEAELFYGKLKSSKIDKVKSIDDGVYSGGLEELFNDGKFYYFVDEKDGEADLKYVKGGKTENVASDVSVDSMQINADRSKAYYLADFGKSSGDLYSFSGKKAKKIASDVATYIHINDDYMYLIKDVSSSTGNADVYRFNGKKEVKIAEDVSDAFTEILTAKSNYINYNGLGE